MSLLQCHRFQEKSDVFTIFQSKAASLLEQEVSLEPASRLKSLRDRVTLTRFDQEVRLLALWILTLKNMS